MFETIQKSMRQLPPKLGCREGTSRRALTTVLYISENGEVGSSPLGSGGNNSGRHLEEGVEVRDRAVRDQARMLERLCGGYIAKTFRNGVWGGF